MHVSDVIMHVSKRDQVSVASVLNREKRRRQSNKQQRTKQQTTEDKATNCRRQSNKQQCLSTYLCFKELTVTS